MDVFKNLNWGVARWEEAGRRQLTSQELDAVDHASVVELQYGYGVCFFLKSGEERTIPLSSSSKLKLGQNVEPSKLEIIKLEKEGEELPIYRVIEL